MVNTYIVLCSHVFLTFLETTTWRGTNTRSARIGVSDTVLQEKLPALHGEMADLGLRQEICKMSLKHLGAPENREVLRKKKKNQQ